jgi:curved DNA-binding protein CbpA
MNYYEILNIKSDATAAEIKAAYETKLDALSPAKFRGHRQFAVTQINDLKKAYSILKNAKKKQQYDAKFNQPETPPEPKKVQPKEKRDIDWKGFYSDTNIELMLTAAKLALDAANSHLENYPLELTRHFIGSPRIHSQQASHLKDDTQALMASIKNTATPAAVIRDEYLNFLITLKSIEQDAKQNPLATELKDKNILDTISQSISFTLFNKSNARLTAPIKKSLDKYVNRVDAKLKIKIPKNRR